MNSCSGVWHGAAASPTVRQMSSSWQPTILIEQSGTQKAVTSPKSSAEVVHVLRDGAAEVQRALVAWSPPGVSAVLPSVQRRVLVALLGVAAQHRRQAVRGALAQLTHKELGRGCHARQQLRQQRAQFRRQLPRLRGC